MGRKANQSLRFGTSCKVQRITAYKNLSQTRKIFFFPITKHSFSAEKNYFHGVKIYFQSLIIYFQGMKINFQSLKIVFPRGIKYSPL